jgi:hypothetical protein
VSFKAIQSEADALAVLSAAENKTGQEKGHFFV